MQKSINFEIGIFKSCIYNIKTKKMVLFQALYWAKTKIKMETKDTAVFLAYMGRDMDKNLLPQPGPGTVEGGIVDLSHTDCAALTSQRYITVEGPATFPVKVFISTLPNKVWLLLVWGGDIPCAPELHLLELGLWCIRQGIAEVFPKPHQELFCGTSGLVLVIVIP